MSPGFKLVCDTLTFCCAPTAVTRPAIRAAVTSALRKRLRGMRSSCFVNGAARPVVYDAKARPVSFLVAAFGFLTKRLQILQVRQSEGRAKVLAQLQPVLFRNRQEYLYNPGIKLRPGAAFDLLSRMGERKRFAVWAIADHGVDRVGNGEDACAQGNILAFQSPRVA